MTKNIKIKTGKKKIINKPLHTIKQIPLTQKEIEKSLNERNNRVLKEFKEGISAIRKYPKSVTFFGSARTKPTEKYYKMAESLAGKICSEGYAVVTGGGPGIMEAGNKGSKNACGTSIGFNIVLPFEQVINPYVTHGIDFHYFFTRKVAMTFSSESYIYFPGGFGTLDEFFEIITLIQTRKITKVPVILVGSDFWNPLLKFIKETLLEKFNTISKKDLDLFIITDDEDEVVKIVKKAKMRNEFAELK